MTTKHWLKAGEIFTDGIGKVTVMAVAGAWAMVRRPRCMPFVIMVKELEQRWQRERTEGAWTSPIERTKGITLRARRSPQRIGRRDQDGAEEQ